MKAKIVVLSALALTGCATAPVFFEPPGVVNPAQDEATCRLEGTRVQASAGENSAALLLGQRAYVACMEAKGYRRAN